VRFRFAGTDAIYKWEFKVNERMVEYEIGGNLIISDAIFGVEAALEGIPACLYLRATGAAAPEKEAAQTRSGVVLASFWPTYPGF
jgi:hypothetical protein